MSGSRNNHIISRLRNRLSLPLPGKEAQFEMAASHRGEKDFNFNFKEDPKESSVLILLFEKEDGFYFPLIERAPYDGVHGGQMGLPGGKIEDQDKDRVATALRETEEEIGVDVSELQVLGRLSELYVQASNYHVIPVVGYLPFIPCYVPDPIEVSDVVEGKLSDLLNNNVKKEKDIIIGNKYTIQAPYFELGGRVVWGATAMMLSEFATILKELE